MLRVIKVTGESLSPEYQEGDYVVLTTIPFFLNRIRVGDIIVFRQPPYGTMIKRVEQLLQEGMQYFVVGAHPQSVDSRQFGPVSREALIGKLIWHIPKPAK
jgi:nickel-type superoxide dismutase maturation protease